MVKFYCSYNWSCAPSTDTNAEQGQDSLICAHLSCYLAVFLSQQILASSIDCSALMLLKKYLISSLRAIPLPLLSISSTMLRTIQAHPFRPQRHKNYLRLHSTTTPCFLCRVPPHVYKLVWIAMPLLSNSRAPFSIWSCDMCVCNDFPVSVWFVHCACLRIQWESRQVGVAPLSPLRNAGCSVHQAQIMCHRCSPCSNIRAMYVETRSVSWRHALHGSEAQRSFLMVFHLPLFSVRSARLVLETFSV